LTASRLSQKVKKDNISSQINLLMFSARIYAAYSVFDSYLNMPTIVKIWHFLIRQIGDCAVVKRFIFTDDPVAI